ncbi:hypothetical protein B0H15DRAFT_807704 [Mycena belliarum]|uniref:Uncharacterized protein n=1 Tax=Mycena belliarum TaxID=1033014 RepID=A0AAD6TKV0_9AGAR|nr:hypothetical protein B0H15DRAFT_807704 [Mycena belliae]
MPANRRGRNRNSRRGQSELREETRKERYLAPGGVYSKGKEKLERLKEIVLRDVHHLDVFAYGTNHGVRVTRTVKELWPAAPADLPDIVDDDSLTLLVSASDLSSEEKLRAQPGGVSHSLASVLSPEECAALEADGPPRYLLMRFAKVIPKKICALLLKDWDFFNSFPISYGHADSNRSEDPALHIGTEEPRADIGGYGPDVHAYQTERIYRWVRACIGTELDMRPALDFGGLFFTIAVKEGSSERIHIDWNDNLHKYALIFCVGDYEGGEFCVPQLNMKVPLRPGSVIAARTRLLAHCSAPLSGRRVVFTCFTDCTLLGHILKGRDVVSL